MNRSRLVLSAALALAIIPVAAVAQPSGGLFITPISIWHEIALLIIGAAIGGVTSPVFQALDFRMGISTGAAQQKANYLVQREIADSLKQLVASQEATATASKEPWAIMVGIGDKPKP